MQMMINTLTNSETMNMIKVHIHARTFKTQTHNDQIKDDFTMDAHESYLCAQRPIFLHSQEGSSRLMKS